MNSGDTAKAEDRRTAVGISVTLSSQLIAASLAMLTIEAAYIVFAVGDRQIDIAFWVSAFVTAIAFIVSVVAAGRGITKARNAGFAGQWRIEAGRSDFNIQAMACLSGLLGFLVVVGSSTMPRDSQTDQEIRQLTTQIETLTIITNQASLTSVHSMETQRALEVEGASAARIQQDFQTLVPRLETQLADLQTTVSSIQGTEIALNKSLSIQLTENLATATPGLAISTLQPP